jgi:predicted N-acyltransferase
MLELSLVDSIAQVGAHSWAELDGPTRFPFLSYEWLSALETSGCLGVSRGWIPRHILIHRGSMLWAVAPAYIKLHSMGEFVFDQQWAEFSEARLGVRYYPKLVVAVPFTPATGPRVLTRSSLSSDEQQEVLSFFERQVPNLVGELGLSSVHVLFPERGLSTVLCGERWVERLGVQFQFQNPDLRNFDEFLATFSSKKRAQIRRERRTLVEQGVSIEVKQGESIGPGDADLAHRLYLSTVDKFVWGKRYLTRGFFAQVMTTMPEKIHFVIARDKEGEVLAGAFNLLGQDTLYGRYWGTFCDLPFLHFNVCLYEGVEECLRRGLSSFSPGAGGAHKRGRGFVPTLTRSLHHLVDPGLDIAVRDFCEREAEALKSEISET